MVQPVHQGDLLCVQLRQCPLPGTLANGAQIPRRRVGGGCDERPWVLQYTSSRTFHINEGLLGYAAKWAEVETPELLLWVDQPNRGSILLEEPIVRPKANAAAERDVVRAECSWQVGRDDVLKIEARATPSAFLPIDPLAYTMACLSPVWSSEHALVRHESKLRIAPPASLPPLWHRSCMET